MIETQRCVSFFVWFCVKFSIFLKQIENFKVGRDKLWVRDKIDFRVEKHDEICCRIKGLFGFVDFTSCVQNCELLNCHF